MEELIRFNLNHYIRVKFKDLGYKIMADNWNELVKDVKGFGEEKRDVEYYRNRADEDGYTRMQAWAFIEQFGEYIGLCKETPFELDILIEVNI